MVYNSLVYECITNSIALQFYCIIFLYNFTLQVHLAVSSSRAVGNERENPPSQINSRNGRSVRRKAGRRNNWIQINIARFQNNYSHSKQCCINISNSKAKMNQALLVVLSFFVVNEDQPVAGWTWGKSATSSSNNSINDDRARYCRICASHTMCLFPFWDEELAKIARRWALQCNIHEKDQCRDVEEFSVAQSVSALDLQDAGNRSEMERLKFHLRSWYSQLEPDFSNSAGVGLATPSVTNVGCGRATYSVAIDDSDVAAAVEVLVCNYGPIDDPETEDDSGCETRSRRYSELCLAGGIFAKRIRRRRASSPDAHRRRGVAPLTDCGKRRRCYYQLSSTVSGAATAAAAALMCLRDGFFLLRCFTLFDNFFTE
ncbi:uncharacterized protein LOC100678265 isoform X4 [Nasonia vitripennis]|uniref:SCP domain-containing protein n=1 Tax=Nasonia vitripennis TaxID=7425 RepID=A0A7M7IUN1_NASVI|nr:uncharacterized protein LOC100678265 isoform X4 [Nasonia vitripennis]